MTLFFFFSQIILIASEAEALLQTKLHYFVPPAAAGEQAGKPIIRAATKMTVPDEVFSSIDFLSVNVPVPGQLVMARRSFCSVFVFLLQPQSLFPVIRVLLLHPTRSN